MKTLVTLISFCFISAAQAQVSASGRVSKFSVDNTDATYSKIVVTVKDLCSVYPASGSKATRITSTLAVLEVVLLDSPCPHERIEEDLQFRVDVNQTLIDLGLDPKTSQLLISLK